MREKLLLLVSIVCAVLSLPIIFFATDARVDIVVSGRVLDVRVVRGGSIVRVLAPLDVVVWGNGSFQEGDIVELSGRLGQYKGRLEFISEVD